MKLSVPALIIMATGFTATAQMQPKKPLFKSAKELSQPFQKKQMSPDLLRLREEIINGTKNVSDLPLYELFYTGIGKASRDPLSRRPAGNVNTGLRSGENIPGNNQAAGSAFQLTKDINPATSSYPTNTSLSNYFDQRFAVINNVGYFWADDGVHGNELWRSDGTTVGTSLVKDIAPGENPSGNSDIVAVNNKLFFRAGGPGDLWSSDGTEAGTQLVTTIPNTGGNTLQFFFAAGNTLYFVSSTPGSIFNQLWKSDGTVAGTTLVYDAGSFNPGWGISHLAYANGILYFTNSDYTHGYELWRTNGTPGGTYVVKDINPSNSDFYDEGPDYLTVYNNQLCFTISDGISRRLWVADATGDNASPAPGYNEITFPYSNYYIFANIPFVISNNYMYFKGYSTLTGDELYRYDPVNGEALVNDITPGMDGTNILFAGSMVNVNNTLYFGVQYNSGRFELWGSRGKQNTTRLVKQFNTGESFYHLFNANGTLLFQTYSQPTGNELWKSNGTDTGTIIVKDIYPGALSSNPVLFTNCNNRVLFTAYGSPTGYELWATDGSGNNTKQVKDINKTVTVSSYAGMNITTLTPSANGLLFAAGRKESGDELYQSDGTTAGTNLIKEIYPGEAGSGPRWFLSKNGYAYFTASGTEQTSYGNSGIYRTDGTANGTVRITTGNTERFAITDNGLLFYVLYNSETYANELWRSNGVAAGTFMLTSTLNYDANPVAVGNTVYFSNGDGFNGYELWKSNGTISGTQPIKDINPGPYSSSPYSLFAFNGYIFFGAYDGVTTSLWRSNGTANGTIKLNDVTPVNFYNRINQNDYFCISGNTLYFVGSDANYGSELWKTTGTVAGTKLVKDIFTGNNGSNPNYLRDINGVIYFQAMDNNFSPGIYGSNGTLNGTRLIKNMGQYFNYPAVASGKYYFVMNDLLYVCDGTEAGTRAVVDPGLTDIRSLTNLTGSGNKLFFSAYSYQYGFELYAGDVTAGGFTSITSNEVVTAPSKFDARIFPNPAKNVVKLTINGQANKVQISITDMNGKNVLIQAFSNISEVSLQVDKLLPGTYFVTVNNGTESKVIKLIKQ